jgi:elongation factor P--(R)-beta-lysine ligase
MSASWLHSRACKIREVRAFFEGRGYLETETPVLVPSPGLDVHLDAFETNGSAKSRYLATSPEYQMKRLLGRGHTRIFQLTRAFRKDEISERHNPEFAILEFYRAGASMATILADTEQLFARITGGSIVRDGAEFAAVPPFRMFTVAEAFLRYASISEADMLQLAESDAARFFELLAFTIEPALAVIPEAVVLYRYPSQFASLAKRCEDDSRYAERFEIYLAGWELCNGFGELTDAGEQQLRFEADQRERSARGLPVYPIDERFMAAMRDGLPACAGNAVGLERLLALTLGAKSVAEIMAFPVQDL